jgi:hypothetical protein
MTEGNIFAQMTLALLQQSLECIYNQEFTARKNGQILAAKSDSFFTHQVWHFAGHL